MHHGCVCVVVCVYQVLEHRPYRWVVKAMATGAGILEKAYDELLEAHSTPETTAKWHALEAAGHWKDQVATIFSSLASWPTLEKYGFSNRKTAEIFHAGVDGDPSYRELRDRCEFIVSMHVELAAEHAWHAVRKQWCMPEKQAILNHPDPKVRHAGMAEIKQLWDTIRKAEQIVVDQTHEKYQEVGSVLKNIHWSRKIWPREDRIDYEKAGWVLTDDIKERAYEKWSAARHTKTTAEDSYHTLYFTCREPHPSFALGSLWPRLCLWPQPQGYGLYLRF